MDVRLASDGQLVAFKRDDTGEVLAVKVDGSNPPHTLVSAEFLAGQNASIWKFDFAPGRHTLYFTLVAADGNFAPYYDLYSVDADSTGATPVLVRVPGQGGIATFSPDSEWMTLAHRNGLELARVDGSEARTIFSYPDEYEPATFGPEILWKQDSSGFSLFHVNAVWFVPTAGDPVVGPTIASLWGVISPDGQNVAYQNPNGEIHLVSPDGKDKVYLTNEHASFGGWLPDSEHFTIIFSVTVEGFYGLANQYSIGAPGEELTPLTDTDDASGVTWLSNDRFLFVGQGELRLRTIGEASVALDENVYNVFEYAWVTP
jgi:hypothetical protein